MSEPKCFQCGRYAQYACVDHAGAGPKPCCATFPLCKPQEGTPDYPPKPSAGPVLPERVSRVPSCDSCGYPRSAHAELAAIRARANGDADDDDVVVYNDRDNLLCMVDELTEERDGWHDAVSGEGGWMQMVVDLRKDRNELRTELRELRTKLQTLEQPGMVIVHWPDGTTVTCPTERGLRCEVWPRDGGRL